MKLNYYESFLLHWLPIYKRQVKDYKSENNIKALIVVRNNINNNIHLTDRQKENILLKLRLIKYEKEFSSEYKEYHRVM